MSSNINYIKSANPRQVELELRYISGYSRNKKNDSNSVYIDSNISNFFSGFNVTVADELAYHTIKNDNLIKEFLPILGLDKLLYSNPYVLSGGEQLCLAILCSVGLSPKIIAINVAFEQASSSTKKKLLSLLIRCAETTVYISDVGTKEILQSNNIFDDDYKYVGDIVGKDNLPYDQHNISKITIKNLTFRYKKNQNIFEKVNLRLYSNKIYQLIGDNGEGKSTFSKLITGLLKPNKGEVLIDNEGNAYNPYKRPGKDVTYSFQNPDHQLFYQTVERELTSSSDLNSLSKRQKLTVSDTFKIGEKELQLHPLDMDLPYYFKKRVSLLSTILSGKRWLIFDEPTIGQNKQSIESLAQIFEYINLYNIGIIIISHDNFFSRLLNSKKLIIDNKGIKNEN